MNQTILIVVTTVIRALWNRALPNEQIKTIHLILEVLDLVPPAGMPKKITEEHLCAYVFGTVANIPLKTLQPLFGSRPVAVLLKEVQAFYQKSAHRSIQAISNCS